MLIAVPSKGRAGKCPTLDFFTDATLFVPESEAHQYQRHYANVVTVPDSVRGITCTRNWILKNCGSPRVVFVDDDLKTQGWTKLYEHNGKQKTLTPEEWHGIFVRLFDTTEQMGWKIWGVKTEAALRSTYPYKPINFRSYVTASCMGMINDGMLFDESFPVKEDYEICLRHIKTYGGIMAARFCHWENSHWGDEGGCKDYRTQKMEADCILRLAKLYPSYIKQITRGGSEYSIQLSF
jgi:hypothetical protein